MYAGLSWLNMVPWVRISATYKLVTCRVGPPVQKVCEWISPSLAEVSWHFQSSGRNS